MEIAARKATLGDCGLLAKWNHQLIRDEGHRNPMTVPELEERMKKWIAGEYTAYLFYDDDTPVAYALFREDEDLIYLRQFYVARSRRREGIGQKAVAILIDRVWPKDKRLVVEALWNNQAGIAFWKAVGYTEYSLTLELGRNTTGASPETEWRQRPMSQVTGAKAPDPAYGSLYRVGGMAALIVAFLTVIEVIAFTFIPQPSTVSGWFILFQANPIIGLLGFWGLEVPMYVMFAIVFLALYVVLRKFNESGMAITLTLALLGIAVFFATNNPFSMLSLSSQFAAATTDAHRSALLAAGQAILANTSQRAIGGFNIGLLLVSVAGLIASSVMLTANSFRRLTAYVGILAFGLSLADYLRQALTSSVTIALLVILPGAFLVVIWFVLVGRRLSQLGHLGE